MIFEGFTFEGDVLLGTIAAFYGFDVSSADKITSLAECVRGRSCREPVLGDCVRFQRIELTVQHMIGKRITKIGFGLRLESPPVRSTPAASIQGGQIWPSVVPSIATEQAKATVTTSTRLDQRVGLDGEVRAADLECSESSDASSRLQVVSLSK